MGFIGVKAVAGEGGRVEQAARAVFLFPETGSGYFIAQPCSSPVVLLRVGHFLWSPEVPANTPP